MSPKDEHNEPVYTDEPLEMETTEDFLSSAEELRKAETRIIFSSDADEEQRNAHEAFSERYGKSSEQADRRLQPETV